MSAYASICTFSDVSKHAYAAAYTMAAAKRIQSKIQEIALGNALTCNNHTSTILISHRANRLGRVAIIVPISMP